MTENKGLLLLCVLVGGLGVGLGVFGPSLWKSRAPADLPVVARSTESRVRVPASPEVGPSWDERIGYAPRMVDVTAQTGINFEHTNGMTVGAYEYLEVMGGGVAVFDYDGDGDLDLYFVNGNRSRGELDPTVMNRLFRNEGRLRFVDVTEEAGVGDHGYGQGCTTADYDGDGDLDLYVTNYGPNVLYQNNGDGTFEDVTQAAGVDDDGWGQSVCFLDFDRDGYLDLFVQNYLAHGSTEGAAAFIYIGRQKVPDYPSPIAFAGAADRLYQNQKDGTFRDVAQQVGVDRQDGKGMGLACVDLTGDRLLDLFVSNDTMENFLYRGRENGQFEEVGQLSWRRLQRLRDS